ncbi:hypothetical protein Dimus_010425 [Dionaea muscipula]
MNKKYEKRGKMVRHTPRGMGVPLGGVPQVPLMNYKVHISHPIPYSRSSYVPNTPTNMRALSRVLAVAPRCLVLARHIIAGRPFNSQHLCCISSKQSMLNNLIDRLMNEPKSRTKAVLDSEAKSTLRSPDFSWHALVAALKSSSLPKAQMDLTTIYVRTCELSFGDIYICIAR